ncbi:hypothetical protein CMUS01_10042 [Colletotrichum musicola]|uniref:Uncharacterized protein n=1 Tax=Colletotrichum musicola TaxID=2175873 RepID=A0A8H6K518_9PEZI|nr:hypothetical protein CMUS01_10042 [Colletotrichum musicola]
MDRRSLNVTSSGGQLTMASGVQSKGVGGGLLHVVYPWVDIQNGGVEVDDSRQARRRPRPDYLMFEIANWVVVVAENASGRSGAFKTIGKYLLEWIEGVHVYEWVCERREGPNASDRGQLTRR